MFMVWSRHHIRARAAVDALLVWGVVALLTIGQMDLQVVCTSGVVAIGQLARFYCFIGSWPSSPFATEVVVPDSVLLSAGAKYLFKWPRSWRRYGTWYLDPASALLNGLVTAKWGRTIYAMDINVWRVLTIHLDANGVDDAIAFPLTN
ncbi:Aste57867_20236 [Aphanomyces stellatus]|uniref:Aste57867_20236 protein n=1 Tax=Aphanomyces stellatus TaxID=120398 RepID=A0A485LGH2_9STRA|nr:hypothetical protein As57867_020170 [Aphanomyces stellatus]VFT96927.1 Aste57867_20236 [Aphanomyces stellatus]